MLLNYSLDNNSMQGQGNLPGQEVGEGDNQLIEFYPRLPTTTPQVCFGQTSMREGPGPTSFLGYKVVCTPVETSMYTSLTAGSADDLDRGSEIGGMKVARLSKDCQLMMPSKRLAESLPVSPVSVNQGTLKNSNCESPKRRYIAKTKKALSKSNDRKKTNLWTSYV